MAAKMVPKLKFPSMRLTQFIMQELQCVQYRVFGAKESKFGKIDVVRLSNMAEIQDGGQNGAQNQVFLNEPRPVHHAGFVMCPAIGF